MRKTLEVESMNLHVPSGYGSSMNQTPVFDSEEGPKKTLQQKLEEIEDRHEAGHPINFISEIHAKNCARIAHIFQMTPQEWKSELNYCVAVVRKKTFGVFMKDNVQQPQEPEKNKFNTSNLTDDRKRGVIVAATRFGGDSIDKELLANLDLTPYGENFMEHLPEIIEKVRVKES